jgi:soluble lytic murein transglycosylase-like protein
LAAVLFYSTVYDLPPKLVTAVITVESSLDSRTLGDLGEIGLMQIRPEYHQAPKGLLYVSTYNIKEGTKRLALAKRNCKHKLDFSWIICYNRGIVGGAKVSYPKKDIYYRKVMKEMSREDFTVQDDIRISEETR